MRWYFVELERGKCVEGFEVLKADAPSHNP